jgi:hypothetical protein
MLLLLGSGISKHNNAVQYASLLLKRLAQDVKYPEMIVCLFKVNVSITFTCIAYLNGLKKVHLKIVHYAERSGSLRIDFMISSSCKIANTHLNSISLGRFHLAQVFMALLQYSKYL